MNKLIESYFSRRGYTPDFLQAIEDGEHPDFANLSALCAELKQVHDSGNRIVVLPDFDMDGIMSGTVGFAGLSELGFCVSLFRPTPSDGYGFTAKTIERLVREYPDAHAIITCDVGITCIEGTERAKELGMKVLVTDHHKQDGPSHPADVVVDPNGADDGYGSDARISGFCGAMVFWTVLDAYAKAYGTLREQEQIQRLRVFAGIGTISDVMPLVYANRELVRDACGICRLIYGDGTKSALDDIKGSRAYVSAFYGLFEALDVFFQNGKVSDIDGIDEEFFGYYLAPMFNSVKRMGGDMDTAFGVFFGSNPKHDAESLFELNERRKEEVNRYFEQLSSDAQPLAPYIFVSSAPGGILGLLATKVTSKTGRPSIVVRQNGNKFTGSGRSPEWYPALSMLRGEGFWAAGHEGAFGAGFTDRRELAAAAAFLEHSVDAIYDELPTDADALAADIVISTFGDGDTDIDIPLFTEFVHELRDFAPFGRGFEAPVVELRFSPDDVEWTTMGSNKQHVKGLMVHGFEFLFWNGAGLLDEWEACSELRVIGELGLNHFAGRTTVNFVGRDVEAVR